MKKIMILGLTAGMAALLGSCDSKSCRCYYYDGVNPAYTETEYVSDGSACSSLDYHRGTQYRTCTEMDEPYIDPGDIGQEYKK